MSCGEGETSFALSGQIRLHRRLPTHNPWSAGWSPAAHDARPAACGEESVVTAF